ncbi:hypothetical protein AGMMS49545_23660 [Betaproteobacteria bacterium]|nr:hypothetical protein AGMMS49545_23660 [Betaproteobacteria bacterium]GHU49054.1 hypothetical protein AGMMS50289_26100 [Betaproteobacteria bacterium]
MPNFIDYYEFSKLANAAYVDLDTDLSGTTIATAVNDAERLPIALAEQTFSSSTTPVWAVSEGGFYGNDDEGFAATLFERGSEKVLAIRGTEPSFDLSGDLLKADLAQIGFLGLAMGQALSMVNFIRRLQAPVSDENVQQLTWNYSQIEPTEPSIPLGDGKGFIYFTELPEATGLELIAPSEKITVTGHSLGGHLAVLAARLFPGLINDCYAFNAPGFDPDTANVIFTAASFTKPILMAIVKTIMIVENVAFLTGGTLKITDEFVDLIGSYLPEIPATSFSQVSIHNLESEDIDPGDDASGVASLLTGAHNLPAEIFIPTERNSHMIEPFMDSLSMQAVLYRLKPDITTGEIENLFRAVSTSNGNVLEKLVVMLRNTLVTDTPAIPNLSKIADAFDETVSGAILHIGTGDIEARREYYPVLLEVENAVKSNPKLYLEILVGKSTGELVGLAKGSSPDAQAYFYALTELNPFAITV